MPRLVSCAGLEFRFSDTHSIMVTFAFQNGSVEFVAGIWDGIYGGFSGWQGFWWHFSDGFLHVFQDSVRNGWWFHADRVLDLRYARPRTFLNYRSEIADGSMDIPIDVWDIQHLNIHDGSTPDTTPNSTLPDDVELI